MRRGLAPLAAAFAHAPHGVAIADPWTGRWVAVNTVLSHLLGYPPDQLLPLGLAAVTHIEDQHLAPAAVGSLLRGVDAFAAIQQRCVRSDGAVIAVRISGNRVRDELSEPQWVVLHFEDLAAEAVAGSALAQLAGRVAESERREAALAAESHELVLVAGRDGRVHCVSPAWRSILGWDPSTLSRISLEDRIHPGDVEAVLAACQRAAADAAVLEHVAFRVRHASGRWRHLRMAISNQFADPAVGGMVLNIIDASELAASEDRVARHQTHDVLTGLPSRHLAADRLLKTLDRQQRIGGQVAVIVFDIVRLGFVNETLGHDAGDALLCEVASRLLKSARPGDTVARLDGDDFVVIADGMDGERDVVSMLTRLRAAVTQPCTIGDMWMVPGVNVGVASTDGRGAPGPDTLLRRAEGAMRQSKSRTQA